MPPSNDAISPVRRALQNEIRRIVRAHCASIRIVGSWHHGDYHLPPRASSFSDLDLVADHPERHSPAQIRLAVIRATSGRVRGTVSIHPPDSMRHLSLDDGYRLNLSEYVAKRTLAEQALRHRRHANLLSYLLCKTTLMLARLSDSERYRDTAARIGTPAARRVLDVKLGVRPGTDRKDALALLTDAPATQVVDALRSLLASWDPRRAVDVARNQLEQAGTMAPWLVEHQLRKLGCRPPHALSTQEPDPR